MFGHRLVSVFRTIMFLFESANLLFGRAFLGFLTHKLYGTQLLPCRVSERVFCALKFRDALDFSSVAQKYLVVTRVHMPRDGNGLSGVGRTRDLPQKVLQDWMASNLFTKKSAQSIFAAVEAYAAARGYSPREATDLRHQLTPRMITFAAGQVVGKRVVRIKH
jgi:hypothetical protein